MSGRKMKVLLINPPIRVTEPPRHPPFGLGVIANVLLQDGHEVEILDLNAYRLSKIETVKRIKLTSNKYDLIGIGGLITTYKYLKWLIPIIKKYNKSSTIVVGGGVVTPVPYLLINNTPADVAVIGEGEITMRELVNKIEKGNSLNNVKGIIYKEDKQIYTTPPRPLIKNLDRLPFPAWDLLPMKIYLRNVAHASVISKKTELSFITARGCPFNCKYCYHIFGRGVRFRSIDKIIEELERLYEKYKFESILFLDETFTINKDRIFEFCDKFEKTLKLPWSCYARVNLVDKEMLKRMKEAGCFWVGYGIESGSQKVLNMMNKGVTTEQAKKAIILTRNCRLICNTTFMFGYPGEDLTTIQETFDFCKELLLRPRFFYTTPYPGTVLYEEVKQRIIEKYGSEENFIEVLGDATKFTINLTDFSDEELIKLKKETERKLSKIPFYLYPKFFMEWYKQLGARNTVSLLTKKLYEKFRR